MVIDHPQINLGLHTSGCLWEWLESHRPEYGNLVGELHRRGQVELLGGGMYEPMRITGTLQTASLSSDLADVGYMMALDETEPYEY